MTSVKNEIFVVCCAMDGFDLPSWDAWLSTLEPCGAREELTQRRAAAWAAIQVNDHATVKRHLEWMLLRRRAIEREGFLLPKAQSNVATQRGRSVGGVENGKRRRAKNAERDDKIRKSYAKLRNPERERAGILARQFKLSARRIRGILKNTETR